MNNSIETLKSFYGLTDYDVTNNATLLEKGGAIVGGLAGVALTVATAYVGWEIGNHVQNALKFGTVFGTTTKVISAYILGCFGYIVSVPTGLAGGMTIGGAVDEAIGKVKESLEKLV